MNIKALFIIKFASARSAGRCKRGVVVAHLRTSIKGPGGSSGRQRIPREGSRLLPGSDPASRHGVIDRKSQENPDRIGFHVLH